MSGPSNVDLLAEGLWGRLRDILMVQSRWDSFVHDPDGEASETAPPPEKSERLASEMIVRALRIAADPVNLAILRRLTEENEVPLTSLVDQTSLSRITLMETINDLSQVGLASYAMETRTVRPTSAATGLVGWIDEVRERLARLVRERWAA